MLLSKRIIFILLFLCLALLFIAGCTDESPTPAPIIVTTEQVETLTSFPTPTLVPALEALDATEAALPPTATPAATITPPPTDTPTATPAAEERLDVAATAMFEGNVEVVEQELEAVVKDKGAEVSAETITQLGISQLNNGDLEAANDTFLSLSPDERADTNAYFFLGETFVANGDCENAELSYNAFLNDNVDLTAYIVPRIIVCYGNQGASLDSQIAQYAAIEDAPAHFLVQFQNRLRLAQLYAENGQYAEAAAVYDKLRDNARTERTRGEMAYYAANAKIADGNTEAGYAAYLQLVDSYPTLYTTYQGLITLVNEEIAVDPFQRGLVDYYAGAWLPCATVFEVYIRENSADFNRDALLYLAWCHEELGNYESALANLQAYADLSVSTTSRGLLEKGHLQRRAGLWFDAITTFDELVTTLPNAPESADAAWWAARLTDWQGDEKNAIERYRTYAESYFSHENAAEALFRAGWLANETGDEALAIEIWQQGAEGYLLTEHGQASLAWLLPLTVTDETTHTLGTDLPVWASYYNLRVHHFLSGTLPFHPPVAVDVTNERVTDRESAETFLRTTLGLSTSGNLDQLPDFITDDPHFVRGEKLWALQLREEAKREFELIRGAYSDDALISYQLALYFRDIGLYRSSIIAAVTVLNLTNTTPFSAPPFIASLAYPTYYSDLIFTLADQYEYDPLLQFALVRQESLYESFATSTAVAQGLAQVIPSTGVYIADKLGRTDFVNEDLYKPYVGLEFGGFYIAEQLQLFGGTTHAALAAYNGGPGNALNWYASAGDDIDRYVETVTFAETRLYIERIYVGYAIYTHLYGE